MTYRKIAILALALLLPLTTIEAQKKKKRVVKKPAVVEEPQEDPRITNMREMTQQIIIIDSIVTDKDQFLSKIRLSSETGSVMTDKDFLGQAKGGYVFLNEMGNKAYFSQPDDSLRQQLYTSDKLGSEWSLPAALQGINLGISEASYPFMLTDGITFYFAAKGEESIGGYDIFFTRYDSRSGSFLKPENIGMPFNSEANDYMYAIDEQNQIGYFVSDRRQPEGKVCVYIFIPSESRRTYDAAVYTEQQIRDFANISRIADTWGNGKERKAALARLKAIDSDRSTTADVQTSDIRQQLIINDQVTYASASECHTEKGRTLYKQLIDARQQLAELNSQLEKSRDYYQKADAAERQLLSKEILSAEDKVLELNDTISMLEKAIRKIENKKSTN